MHTARRVALTLMVLTVALFAVAGCGGPTLEEEFTNHFETQGAAVDKLDVAVSPHEAQVVMDLMILESHGIDTKSISDKDLIHATVTLANGEQVTAVKYGRDIYTYSAD